MWIVVSTPEEASAEIRKVSMKFSPLLKFEEKV